MKKQTSKEQKFREELFSEKLKVNIAYDTGKEQGIKQGRLQALDEVEKIIDNHKKKGWDYIWLRTLKQEIAKLGKEKI